MPPAPLPPLGEPDGEAFAAGYRQVCGVDEVGRGPLAGPVVAAAVVLPPHCDIPGLGDSKKLTARARARLVPEICARALATGIGVAEVDEIDRVNILQASLRAMVRAVEALGLTPDFLLIDGVHPVPSPLPQRTLVGGDGRSRAIAAASILAKQHRDALMVELGGRYPGYGLEFHMGYPTAAHRVAVRKLGPSPVHRRTFKGVREFIGKPIEAPAEGGRSVSRHLGERGEALAEMHLKRLGYRILERNYRCGLGEIDRIAVQGKTLVFLEVKARRTQDFGGPLEAVDRRKRRKLTRLAQYYVAQKGLYDTPRRFDVVGVWFDGAEPRVEVFANAFEAEE